MQTIMFNTKDVARALSQAGWRFYCDGMLAEARAQYGLAAQVWAADGNGRMAQMTGLLAVCICHEINARNDVEAGLAAKEVVALHGHLAPVVGGVAA